MGSAPRSSKRRRTDRFRFEVADPTAAQTALLEASLGLRRAKPDELDAARARHEAAQAALDACYDHIRLRALTPSQQQEFNHEQAAAADAHEKAAQAAGEDLPQPEPTWTADSFEVRLIAACDTDENHTAEWWAAELVPDGEWTLDERAALLEACFNVNEPRRSFDLGLLGKG